MRLAHLSGLEQRPPGTLPGLCGQTLLIMKTGYGSQVVGKVAMDKACSEQVKVFLTVSKAAAV